ncbi:hypothetical protein EZV62_000649 [Acer yangbiense]|uniref:DUF7081 domain-containing protein n=1 Tax=Acer yangbiense TaxID=1000413 RepID=A0A5C7IRW7_9ROSI|nr:hypothetical protein EZV62_000649 [Acer yangbiense]
MPGPINVSNPIEEADNFLMPISSFEVGEGLPYAPMDWPNPGDNWGWRVGKRIDDLGYYTERFLYLPRRIQRADVPRRHFDSKLALKRYLKSEFSDADIEGFFAGFSWKVLSENDDKSLGDETTNITMELKLDRNQLPPGVKVFVAVMSDHSSPPIYMPAPINVCKPAEGADNFLKPVTPCEVGEGLPYAPMDWPNPGDNWGWRVGKRISNVGYYSDRFLYLPKRIQRAGAPRHFASKLSLERFLKSEFPGADLEGFFASFSWKVPSSLAYSTDVKATAFSPEPPKPETEKVEEETSTVKRKMKHTAASSSVKRQTRQSRRQSIDEAGDTYESPSLNNQEAANESPGKDMKNTTDLDDLFEDKNSPDEPIPKEFDNYLDSLVDSLAQPRSETPLPHTVTVNSPPQENDLAAARRLEENKAKVTSLRQEYNELKENATLLQAEIDSNLSSLQGIDDQIAQLKSQRAQLMKTMETKKMARFKVIITQKKVAEEITRAADEIQLSKARKSQNGG